MAEDGFLSRWSRRKLAGRGEAVPTNAPAAPDPAPSSSIAGTASGHGGQNNPAKSDALSAAHPGTTLEGVAPPAPEAAPFDPTSLPPVESLTRESDITAFLRQEVPRALRDAALRRVWTLDPAIRDFIGPADYAWDFHAPEGIPGFAPTLSGDIGKLLAQAIGKPLTPEPSAPASPQLPLPPPLTAPVATPAPAEIAATNPAPTQPVENLQETPPSVLRDATREANSAPRRHGGARPV